MLTKPARRRGFTLIEILVVISLIAVLAALSVGALFRVRAAQQTSNTEGTLGKLDTLMMARWSAVLTKAKNPPPEVISYCDGDKERAVSVWTYAVLKNEFPVSFAELVAININGANLEPRTVFTKGVKAKAIVASLKDTEESAALFYAAIMDTGTAGTANTLEGLQQQVATTPSGLTVFNDNWGREIVFIRHATNAEIQGPPHSKPSAGGFKNPLDPRGLLLTNAWANRVNAAKGLMGNMVTGFQSTPPPDKFILLQVNTITGFQTENFIPTLISAGPDKDFGTALGGAAGDSGNDNLLSYRRREGTRRD